MGPHELANKFNGTIEAKYSTFGSYQYGFSTIGRLFYHHNALNMVDTDYACKPLTDIEIPSDSFDVVPIVLVDRGNCTFVTKVRNVQNIGGKVALIVNDQEDDNRIFGLQDDGTGKDIHIPGILITKKEGEIIKEYIKWANLQKGNNTVNNDIVLNIDNRPEELLADKVDLTLSFIANDKKIYRLLTELKDNKDIFEGNQIHFIPNYVTVQHYNYDSNQNADQGNCFCHGRYCSYGHNYYSDSFLNNIDPTTVLTESIRQKCIYNLAYKKTNTHHIYWTYMTEFYKNCLNKNNFDLSCSRSVIKSIDSTILFDVERCYLDSFENDSKTHSTSSCTRNKILEEDRASISPRFKEALPIVSVNNSTFYGSWLSDSILQALCSNLKHKPSSCFTSLRVFGNKYNDDAPYSMNAYHLMGLVSILVAINLLVVYWCRRYASRKTDSKLLQEEELTSKINAYVSSYLKMKDIN